MKALTIAASAAILLAGVSIAAAQTQVPVSPANINKGAATHSATKAAHVSGSESNAVAKPKMHVLKKKKMHTAKKMKATTTGAKKDVPLSPANINKGADTQSSTSAARKSGNEPNSMAK